MGSIHPNPLESGLRQGLAATILLGCAAALRAQGNYEVQVYGAELVPKGVTMFEIHSNFTAKGTSFGDGVLATIGLEQRCLVGHVMRSSRLAALRKAAR